VLENLSKYTVTLASNSPRRQSLLSEMGVSFSSVSSQGEEIFPETMPVEEVAEFLAIQKADFFTDFSKNQLYITADTVVVLGQHILGKPSNAEEAKKMLRMLSGKTHTVITGMCVKSEQKQISFSDRTQVTFRTISDEMITHYVDTYSPMDKAGSYGIQEWIGLIGVSSIEGSYFNVMGLPTARLFSELTNF
jgi:septum formation protein